MLSHRVLKRYIRLKKSHWLFFVGSLFLKLNNCVLHQNSPLKSPKNRTKALWVCSFSVWQTSVWQPAKVKNSFFRFYFANFICQKIGISNLYISTQNGRTKIFKNQTKIKIMNSFLFDFWRFLLLSMSMNYLGSNTNTRRMVIRGYSCYAVGKKRKWIIS